MWKKLKEWVFAQLMKKTNVEVTIHEGKLVEVVFEHPLFRYTWTPGSEGKIEHGLGEIIEL